MLRSATSQNDVVRPGETKIEDVEKALPEERPDFIFPSLKEVDDAMFGA